MGSLGRVAAAFALASVVLVGAVWLASLRAVRSVLRANLEAPAREKRASVVESMRVGLSLKGRPVLVPYLSGCLVGFGARYAAAFDAQDRLVAHTSGFPEGAAAGGGSVERWVDGEPVLELAIPVDEPGRGPLGRLVLGFSLAETLALERRIAARSAAAAAAAGAAALLALLLVIRRGEEALRRGEERVRQSERLSAVGQLAAGIAHEINNPLGSILGFAQAGLRREDAAPALRKALEAIEEEARRCRRLVQDLLTFARRDEGNVSTFVVVDALEGTLAMLESQARVQDVEIQTDFPARAAVRGEKSRLQQAFLNLASNALDAMPKGGRLRLATRYASLRGGGAVAVDVADTGPGIPDEAKARVFEPFFTTKEAGRGTGLGLAIVSEVVAAYSGEVSLRDAEGGGTVFTVTLPLA
jgi:signal transduction histidine kinase